MHRRRTEANLRSVLAGVAQSRLSSERLLEQWTRLLAEVRQLSTDLENVREDVDRLQHSVRELQVDRSSDLVVEHSTKIILGSLDEVRSELSSLKKIETKIEQLERSTVHMRDERSYRPKRLGKWLVVSLTAAAVLVTLTMRLGRDAYRPPPVAKPPLDYPPAQQSRPKPEASFRDLLVAAVREQMSAADVAFEARRSMVVNKPEIVIARIASPTVNREELVQAIKDPQVRRITASAKMRLTLTGDTGAIRIEAIAPQGGDQLLLPDRAATWTWRVVGNRPGNSDLYLDIAALVRIDGKDEIVGIDLLTCRVTMDQQPVPEMMKEISSDVALKLYQNVTSLIVTSICSGISALLLFFYRDRVRAWLVRIRDQRVTRIVRP